MPNLKSYLNNRPKPSVANIFGRNTSKQISISRTDQSADTNRTRMEHLLVLTITIGSKELAIISVHLGNKLILHDNQAINFVDIQGHCNQEFNPAVIKVQKKWVLVFSGTQITALVWIHWDPLEEWAHRLPVPGRVDLTSLTT